MEDFSLLIDLHRRQHRQGPGSDTATARAIDLAGLRDRRGLTIADIGCGCGAQTAVLAQLPDAKITAVDLFPEFLAETMRRVSDAGASERVSPLEASMDDLPFAQESLDVMWAEGAIYNIGFANGLRTWHPFLKTGGVLAVSELTWLTAERPEELQTHWDAAYPEVATASEKMAALEKNGFRPHGYFPLDKTCWMEEYYEPLSASFDAFLKRHGSTQAAEAIVSSEKAEIALYERYADYVSYGFYIAEKL